VNESAPLVSVVVPTYQSAAFVERTLDSVLAQTYPSLELVVADHGSTDGTWEKLQPYAVDQRVRILRTDPGGGAERNWNRVTDEASGTYVKLVCADDLVYPNCVAEQVNVMEKNPDVALVAAKRDLVDSRGRTLIHGRGLGGLTGKVDGRTAIRRTVRAGSNIFGEPACVLLRTEMVHKVGGWSGRKPYLIDEDLYVRVLVLGDFFAIPRTLAAFRVSDTQWSVNLARQQARQAVSFHRQLRATEPDVVSHVDELVGSLRAAAIAWARRAAYQVWRRRMRPTADLSTERRA
jgi:glycosyltransferase involved in cell wall biosynthesis